MGRGGLELACCEVGMSQLCQDCGPPWNVRCLLRKRQGQFKELERLSGLAQRLSRSCCSDERAAPIVRSALSLILPCGIFPQS